MDKHVLVEVEVAYATAEIQSIKTIQVVDGTPAREVLNQSGLNELFPEIDIANCPMGVFGSRIDDGYCARAGDRIEVYRPLARDPRDARRELAARGLTIDSSEGRD